MSKEHVVDYLGLNEEWYGDEVNPRPEPRKHYFKERPLQVRVTAHCNWRASDGWRLVQATPDVQNASTEALLLFFARETASASECLGRARPAAHASALSRDETHASR